MMVFAGNLNPKQKHPTKKSKRQQESHLLPFAFLVGGRPQTDFLAHTRIARLTADHKPDWPNWILAASI